MTGGIFLLTTLTGSRLFDILGGAKASYLGDRLPVTEVGDLRLRPLGVLSAQVPQVYFTWED
jgi:hypothetical protein